MYLIFLQWLIIMCLSNFLPLGRFCLYKADILQLKQQYISPFSFMGNLVRLHAGLEEHRRAGYQIYYYNISKQNVLFPLKTSQTEKKINGHVHLTNWFLPFILLPPLWKTTSFEILFHCQKKEAAHTSLYTTANLQLICQLVGS